MEYYKLEEGDIVNKLKKQYYDLESQIEELQSDLTFFINEKNLIRLDEQHRSTKERLDKNKIIKTQLSQNLIKINLDLKKLNYEYKNSKSIFHNLFRNRKSIEKEKNIKNNLLKSEEEKKDFENKLNEIEDKIIFFQKTIIEISAKQEKSKSFDERITIKKIKSYKDELQKLKSEIDRYVLINNKVVDELGNDIKKLNEKIKDYNYIKSQQDQLSYSDSYYRKLIHEDLEEKFGDGNITRLIKKYKYDITKLKEIIDRNYTKIQKIGHKLYNKNRIQEYCKKIIIDGNNLTYDNNNNNIGLEALLILVNYLSRNLNYEIILIFDKNFETSIDIIKEAIPHNVKLTSGNEYQDADSLITSLGNDKKDTYILSNDNFKDYSSNEIIKNNRLIKHNLSRNFIKIPLLDIILEY